MNGKILALVVSVSFMQPILPSASAIGTVQDRAGVSDPRTNSASLSLHFSSIPPAPAAYIKSAARRYRGQSIVYYGDSLSTEHEMDVAMAASFERATGIHITIVVKPSDSDQALAAYTRLFSARSRKFDVMMLDQIWVGAVGKFLLPLDSVLGKREKQYDPSLLKSDSIHGHLMAVPWFSDFGLLYYRKDLLSKYHVAKPPTTWDQLADDAKKIQSGERKKNGKFYGFVFQGNPYEGLTCDALEWIASSGGGDIVDHGRVTLDNPKAVAAIGRARSWVGSISPESVTTFTETESGDYFDSGDAAFMRNWPSAYATAQSSKAISGSVGVAPLPHGQGGVSSATVGGWQVGVSKYSTHAGAAEAWAEYLTSAPVQQWRAVNGSLIPTITTLVDSPSIQKAEPFLGAVKSERHVFRPSIFFGSRYNQASNIFWEGVSEVLDGASQSSVMRVTAQQMASLGRS